MLTSGTAAAQAKIAMPDTLRYPAQQVATLTNASGAALTIDSLAMQIGGPRAYHLQLTAPRVSYDPVYLNPSYRKSFAAGATLNAGESAQLRVLNFDACTVCGGAAGGAAGWSDLLLVYAGGSRIPDTLHIDPSNAVSAEDEASPAAALRLRAYPNPTSGAVGLQLDAATAGQVSVEVLDLLGRVVWQQRAGFAAERLVIPADALPAGMYVVRATGEDGARAVVTLVLNR